jgi:hypothetical protein
MLLGVVKEHDLDLGTPRSTEQENMLQGIARVGRRQDSFAEGFGSQA